VRESRTLGSVEGAQGDLRPYSDTPLRGAPAATWPCPARSARIAFTTANQRYGQRPFSDIDFGVVLSRENDQFLSNFLGARVQRAPAGEPT
jgi:hypothetical protein